MAKFCTNCGKKLNDGEQCSCQQEVVANESIVTSLLNLVKGIFTEPVKTMKNFIDEDNFNTSLIALGISAVSVAVLVAVLCKELFVTLFGLVGMSSGISSSTLSMTGLMTQIEIPYVKIVIITLVTVIAVYAMIAGIAYVISAKIFKSETSYKKMITLLGSTAGLMTVLCLVTALCVFINLNVALVVYAAGAMLNTYYMYKGLSFACDTDENKLGYVLMPAVLITTLVVSYILPRVIA